MILITSLTERGEPFLDGKASVSLYFLCLVCMVGRRQIPMEMLYCKWYKIKIFTEGPVESEAPEHFSYWEGRLPRMLSLAALSRASKTGPWVDPFMTRGDPRPI